MAIYHTNSLVSADQISQITSINTKLSLISIILKSSDYVTFYIWEQSMQITNYQLLADFCPLNDKQKQQHFQWNDKTVKIFWLLDWLRWICQSNTAYLFSPMTLLQLGQVCVVSLHSTNTNGIQHTKNSLEKQKQIS